MAKPNQSKTKQNKTAQFVLAFTQDEVNQLNALLNELPAKFANPVFQFCNMVLQKRVNEQKANNAPPDEKQHNADDV